MALGGRAGGGGAVLQVGDPGPRAGHGTDGGNRVGHSRRRRVPPAGARRRRPAVQQRHARPTSRRWRLDCLARGVPAVILLLLACTDPPPAPQAAPLPVGYAGSAACARCHPSETAAWSGSHHGLAERAVGPEDPALPPGHGEALRIIGVDPLRQALVAGDRGALQVPLIGWDPAKEEWFSTVEEERAPGEWGHGTGRGANWNSRCASCHVTGFEKGYAPATDTWASTFVALGVGCEACHGPASAHAAGGPPPPTGTCAACHSVRA
ncbi:MAG: hypothetical protein H0V89_05090, partial [Deltaproteobacteria bacterium]|nr:hypothetical protein [Deltaproteobacteria bacterium]